MLFGDIPVALIGLGSLSYLDLSSNFLTVTVPSAIGALLQLKTLILANNSLTGSIPRELGNLFSLIMHAAPSAPEGGNEPLPSVGVNLPTVGEVFTFVQLAHATLNFGEVNLIKHGKSGDIYQEVLENGSCSREENRHG
ncbi:hypothetical protein IEQ34_005945 [Dendrobium chrysotoxum]|uniref:Uncharacterized protein n=1 Tax=Dendrobium chrysotoxum TaxID=161865 RepID=A0AAV7HD79_DENCH|nr:hypothetical protein IEQ34_005945 [Dendrobium chrysotoxum]